MKTIGLVIFLVVGVLGFGTAAAADTPEQAQCVNDCGTRFFQCEMMCQMAGEGMSPLVMQKCFSSCKARFDQCATECYYR
jgi:hypothetical protein